MLESQGNRWSFKGAAGRLGTIAGHELRAHLTGPLFWVLLAMLLFITSALNPVAMIPSGDAAVGGVRPYINSPYALAQTFAIGSFFAYTFFAALLAGLSVIRDDESTIADLIHSTPLTPAEYILGKVTGVSAALGLAFAAHLLMAIGFYQLKADGAIQGPFHPGHYLIPALVFAAPGIWFSAAIAFAVGERTRRPMAVYAVPTVLFVVTLTVFWTWAPPSLDPRLSRLLMILDPTSLRWLSLTLFKVDRGVDFYNTAPLAFDATLVLSRLFALVLPALAVLASIRHFRVTLGGKRVASKAGRREPSPAAVVSSPAGFSPLRILGMTSRSPGLFTGAGTILQSELRELIRQPALYLFTAFLMLVVVEVAGTDTDVFGAPVLLTAGTLAVRTLPVVTVLVCLYLLFTVIESMQRERTTKLDSIFHASPVSGGAILLGKGLVAAVVIGVLSAACIASGLLLLLLQAGGRVEIWPLVLVFGVVLAPTFLVWTAFVTAVTAVVRSRAAALSTGLVALVLTGFHFMSGSMTWVSNWPLWGALRWSDMGTFPLHGSALLLNRAVAVGAAVFLFALAFLFLPRTERDAAATLHRLRPEWLFRRALRLAPFALMPLLAGSFLGIQVRDGYQGQAAEERSEERSGEIGRRNVHDWHGVVPAAVERMDLKLDLEPAERRLRVDGTYSVVNATGEPMRRLPYTIGFSFGTVSWTVDGEPVPAEDRDGLQILTLREPLAPGGTARVGFAYDLHHPRGISRNGGGADSFILPAGVLLSTHRGELLPVPGFVDRGEDRGEDGWSAPFQARVEVRAPSEYTVNASGTKTAQWSADGRTTVVWESGESGGDGQPVHALNLIAGRWDVRRKDGAAVFYHPGHPYNVDRILDTLAAARSRYSEWFHPYPWQELRISEFPDLETNATAFPANISFSEGIGFLTGGDPRAGLAFSVTAHEAAHQWWGHLLRAGDGPGTGLLIEGMANYSALLLHESENGPAARVDFARQLERIYLEQRRVNGERPLLATMEERASDEAVLSQKGAWVMWMLHNHLGRDRMLAGLRDLVGRHVRSRQPATPQDLIAALRRQSQSPAGFQRFVDQWLAGVVLPEFKLSGASLEPVVGGWRAAVTVANVGTGTVEVEIAAARGPRQDRRTVTLGPGSSRRVTWTLGFQPERIVVDPDALVLQLNRGLAVAEVEGGSRMVG